MPAAIRAGGGSAPAIRRWCAGLAAVGLGMVILLAASAQVASAQATVTLNATDQNGKAISNGAKVPTGTSVTFTFSASHPSGIEWQKLNVSENASTVVESDVSPVTVTFNRPTTVGANVHAKPNDDSAWGSASLDFEVLSPQNVPAPIAIQAPNRFRLPRVVVVSYPKSQALVRLLWSNSQMWGRAKKVACRQPAPGKYCFLLRRDRGGNPAAGRLRLQAFGQGYGQEAPDTATKAVTIKKSCKTKRIRTSSGRLRRVKVCA